MTNNLEKLPMERLTVSIHASLLADIQRHRKEIFENTGLDVSTSATVSALIRSALMSDEGARAGFINKPSDPA